MSSQASMLGFDWNSNHSKIRHFAMPRYSDDEDEEWNDPYEPDSPADDEDDYDPSSDSEPLIACPHCGEPILEDVPQCPYCRQYVTRAAQAWQPKPLWIAITVALLLLSMVLWMFL